MCSFKLQMYQNRFRQGTPLGELTTLFRRSEVRTRPPSRLGRGILSNTPLLSLDTFGVSINLGPDKNSWLRLCFSCIVCLILLMNERRELLKNYLHVFQRQYVITIS